MARTGARAKALCTLLQQAGLSPRAKPAPPSVANHATELDALYRELGGVLAIPTWRPGPWDLAFAGPLVVELDEELHFNRYRALTLNASWGSDLPWTEAYRSHCASHENRCLKAGTWGRRWSNDSCARMFTGGPPGQLDGPGAPRWKQRAFYDAIKDSAAGSGIDLAIARVAIYDPVNGAALEDVLEGRACAQPVAILALVEHRTVAGRAP
jgi:hypothetical protein